MAGSTGLEPATSDVTGRRSNQTELTPQAAVRIASLLRELVYTETLRVRKNFFEKVFGPPAGYGVGPLRGTGSAPCWAHGRAPRAQGVTPPASTGPTRSPQLLAALRCTPPAGTAPPPAGACPRPDRPERKSRPTRAGSKVKTIPLPRERPWAPPGPATPTGR